MTTLVDRVKDVAAAQGWHPKRLLDTSWVWLCLTLATLLVFFSAYNFEAFASGFNLVNIVYDASALLLLSVGMTFVIITAGIDLSVGAVLLFAEVIAAKAMIALGGAGWGVVAVGFVVALGIGFVWGTLNGFLIAKVRVPPLVATLGTLGMAGGGALIVTGGVNVRTGIPQELTTTIGAGRLFGSIPYVVVIVALVTVVAGVVLSATRFGRHTYAIGSNPEAARRSSIPVESHLIKIYAITGTLAGLAGVIDLARFSTTTLGAHTTDNLDAVAAVVIGGTSLFGGIGTIFGTIIGVFIPATLRNGFVIIGVQPFWQQVAIGAVLILAVIVDQRRRAARRKA